MKDFQRGGRSMAGAVKPLCDAPATAPLADMRMLSGLMSPCITFLWCR